MWGKRKGTKRKILLVDYEEDFTKALQIRLKANGYDVVLAFHCVQGFTAAQKEKPNLIILDIMVPGGGGFAMVERLKLSMDTRDIPVIFLTGISGGEEKAYRAGACSYLTKPYDPNELLGVIERALNLNERSSPGIREDAVAIVQRS
jgi:DNA-binding response OmpR family regulator